MRIISILEAVSIVKKILIHLDLWDTRNHDPPSEDDSLIPEIVNDGKASSYLTYLMSFSIAFHPLRSSARSAPLRRKAH
jgi:hypothetical protein